MQPAVFLDRDGTLIEDSGYLRDVARVRLLPGVAETLRALRQAGYRLIVATNQSGVARGLLTEATLAAIHDRMRDLLAQQGVQLDAVYYCPYHPEGTVEAYRRDSDCRKPECGMLRQAAADLGIDLPASWMVGDAERDVEAGRRAGCRTVLLTPDAGADGQPVSVADFVVQDLPAAGRVIARAGERESNQVESHGYGSSGR